MSGLHYTQTPLVLNCTVRLGVGLMSRLRLRGNTQTSPDVKSSRALCRSYYSGLRASVVPPLSPSAPSVFVREEYPDLASAAVASSTAILFLRSSVFFLLPLVLFLLQCNVRRPFFYCPPSPPLTYPPGVPWLYTGSTALALFSSALTFRLYLCTSDPIIVPVSPSCPQIVKLATVRSSPPSSRLPSG